MEDKYLELLNKVFEKAIKEASNRIKSAIDSENWFDAGEREAYMQGLEQGRAYAIAAYQKVNK